MTTWMLYSVAVSAVLALCAWSLERGLRRSGTPVRWLWVGALLASLGLSALPWLRSAPAAMTEAPVPEWIGPEVMRDRAVEMPVYVPAPPLEMPAAPGRLHRLDAADGPLLALWAFASIAGMLYLVGTHRTLSRRRRLWRPATLDGVPALVSRDVGPAVVGFLDSAIVVPHWVERMDAERRRMVLAHEEEHLRAGDARLLSLALVALAIAPWNAPLWWQVRRLRHAVELDCDARVLEGNADAGQYCELLIEVGERAAMRGIAFAAFAESSSFLERRILSMVGPRPRRWTLAVGLCATLAGFLALYACEAPIPTLPVTSREEPAEAELVEFHELPEAVELDTTFVWTGAPTVVPVLTEDTVGVPASTESMRFADITEAVNWSDVTELVRRRHPGVHASGLPLEKAVWFVVDREGRIAGSWVDANLYIDFHEQRAPIDPRGDRRARLARAQADARRAVQARVPGMQVRGMAAVHFYAGDRNRPAPFTVHFFTEGADNPTRDGELVEADRVVMEAVEAELRR